MSLLVDERRLALAEAGRLTDEEFLDVVRGSLPYAWQVVEQVCARLAVDGGAMADHEEPPPGDAERGQLLRAMASDAIRGALERHHGVRLAFQNCHRVGAFTAEGVAGPQYAAFVSVRGQVLNQRPELRNC